MDEFLATCLLLTKFPVKRILRVNALPERIPDNAVVLDIGRRYDGERFFDHHQDPELPSTLVLVMRRFFPEINPEDIPWIRFIDLWDRLGPRKAQESLGIKLPNFSICPVDAALLREFSKRQEITPDDPLYQTMKLVGRAVLELMEEEKRMLEKAKSCVPRWVKGVKVVICDEPLRIEAILRVHGDDVAVVVQPSLRTPDAWSLIRINDHPRVDFRRILGKVPAKFVHANGFLAVVAKQDIERALELAIE